MSLLAVRIGVAVLALLALLVLRGNRWAYFVFVVLGLAYFPAQAHFHLAIHFPKCEQLISKSIVLLSVQDYVHIAIFAGFYWMSWVQFRQTDARILWAFLATLVVGALLEIAEGMSLRGAGHCRVRDLVPAAAGALGAALVLAIWSRLTRKPGYVRLAKPRQAVASSKPVAPQPVSPLRGIPTLPVAPRGVVPSAPPRGFPPPPPDFSPGATLTPDAAPADTAPTEEVAVAPHRKTVAQPELVQRLRAIPHRLRAIRLQAIPQFLLAMLQRFWGVIRAGRQAIVTAVVVLVVVGAAGVALLLYLPSPAPTKVAEQPRAAGPPPRPLQSEAEGYYEPDYQFTIGDRRFTRLTLRPDAFLTFARYGGHQESGCEDARIGESAVYVRCEADRVGIVTIDGQFTSRFATSRLDTPVLSAFITVKNPRGEVLYRARDSFRWHEPD